MIDKTQAHMYDATFFPLFLKIWVSKSKYKLKNIKCTKKNVKNYGIGHEEYSAEWTDNYELVND